MTVNDLHRQPDMLSGFDPSLIRNFRCAVGPHGIDCRRAARRNLVCEMVYRSIGCRANFKTCTGKGQVAVRTMYILDLRHPVPNTVALRMLW